MGHKELPVTHLRKVMLEELQRRKFSSATIRGYLGALLVSCDCDVAGWRKHMLQMQPKNPVWSAPIDILSPLDLAGAVLPSIHVALLTGAADNIVPPSICSGYVEALRKRVHNVTLTIAPGLGHDMLLEPVTYDALKTLVQSLK